MPPKILIYRVNLGLIPGFGGTQRLSRLIGVAKAKEMILTGKIIDAKEAESIGLVNTVVKDGEVMANAEGMAMLIAQEAPPHCREDGKDFD